MTATNALNARYAPMHAHFNDCEAGREALAEYIAARERGIARIDADILASNILQRAGYNVNAKGGVSIDTDEADE